MIHQAAVWSAIGGDMDGIAILVVSNVVVSQARAKVVIPCIGIHMTPAAARDAAIRMTESAEQLGFTIIAPTVIMVTDADLAELRNGNTPDFVRRVLRGQSMRD